MIGLTEQVIAHQRQAEWLFAASVFNNDDLARTECGWLDPSALQDEAVRGFWSRVKEGMESSKAAIETGIFYKLSQYMTANTFSSSYLGSFAESIADDRYLVRIAESIKRLAGLIAERRLDEIRQEADNLGKLQPGGHEDGSEAVEASLDFSNTIDDLPDLIPTRIPKIDATFGGFARGTLTILAARPSMGKTSLALQMARACADAGFKCLYFSIEMKRKALWSRMVCGEAEVDHRLYKTRTWTDEQRQACLDANLYLLDRYGMKLHIDDRPMIHNADIWKAAARIRPDLLIVDHLALVADKAENNNLRIGKITWAGKQVAKEFNCASLYLCQLSREVDRREVKVPTLVDLRDSGEIEQDADAVLFIHRKDYYEDVQPKISPTDLKLSKDREGVRNVNYVLQYHLVKQKFYETAQEAKTINRGREYAEQG